MSERRCSNQNDTGTYASAVATPPHIPKRIAPATTPISSNCRVGVPGSNANSRTNAPRIEKSNAIATSPNQRHPLNLRSTRKTTAPSARTAVRLHAYARSLELHLVGQRDLEDGEGNCAEPDQRDPAFDVARPARHERSLTRSSAQAACSRRSSSSSCAKRSSSGSCSAPPTLPSAISALRRNQRPSLRGT